MIPIPSQPLLLSEQIFSFRSSARTLLHRNNTSIFHLIQIYNLVSKICNRLSSVILQKRLFFRSSSHPRRLLAPDEVIFGFPHPLGVETCGTQQIFLLFCTFFKTDYEQLKTMLSVFFFVSRRSNVSRPSLNLF